MNFFYRHRIALGFFSVILAVLFTFGVCFFALSRTAAEAHRLTVVIDAGHGGIDGGVTGVITGTKESDINLSISRLLQDKLEEAGFYVVMTRKTEAGLYGAATTGYKKRDMTKRAEIIHQSAPVLVISVHQNYFPLSSRRGAQVFFQANSEKSQTLACMIQTAFNEQPDCPKQVQPLLGDYYILNCSDYISVLVECGFLSNEQDEALLLQSDYQKRVADTIAQGALTYLATQSST